MTRVKRGRAGQIRIIEAALAAVIMLFALIAVDQFTRNPRLVMTSRSGTLRSMAYNALYRLADLGVLDNTLGRRLVNWELHLKIVLATLLPTTVYYNLTVYAFNNTQNPSVYVRCDTLNITNTLSPVAFTQTPEIASATFLYVTFNSRIYMLRLQIAEGGVST